MKIQLARIKKSLVAGVGAGVSAALTYQITIGFKLDGESIGATVGALFAAGVPVGWAAWKAKNAPGYGSTVQTRAGDLLR